MLSGARSSMPLIATMKSPTDTSTPGAASGARRSGIPALGVVDPRDLVAALVDDQVCAEEPARRLRHVRHVAASNVGVADGDLGAHVVEQVIQIGAMVHEREELSVHLLHLRPVAAVEVRHVEVVALVAPAFVENLLVLFARVEIHAQADVEASLPCLRRSIAVRIDQEEVHGAPACGRATTAAASTAATAGAIEQLAAVGADRVLGDAGHERRSTPIAQAIPLKGAATAAGATTAAAPASRATRLEVEHRSGRSGLELRVLTDWNAFD